MKVLLVNGGPHPLGCTNAALSEVAKTLNEEGIDTEIFWIGNGAIHGCIACMQCGTQKKCVFDDKVNEFALKCEDADGFVFGSPVHYASATGAITSFMDRLFYSSSRAGKNLFYMKPGAIVTSARRAGTTATFDQLNKYFTISQMPIVSSRYWNMVHGANAEEVLKDEEGLQTMRILGRNMAYLLKCQAAGRTLGVELPKTEKTIFTNFINESR